MSFALPDAHVLSEPVVEHPSGIGTPGWYRTIRSDVLPPAQSLSAAVIATVVCPLPWLGLAVRRCAPTP
jgi:hypothetical protein